MCVYQYEDGLMSECTFNPLNISASLAEGDYGFRKRMREAAEYQWIKESNPITVRPG